MTGTSSCSDLVAEVVATISEGLMLVSPQGKIEMVNPALERLTGYSAAELTGQPCTVLGCGACDEARRGASGWCRLFERGTESSRRCDIVRKDGVRVPVSKNARVVRKDGRVAGAVETFTDMSEVVERDRRIEALARMLDRADGFAGMVGVSPAMQRVYRIVERAADSDAPVLILGPSGCGKELAARAVHDLGHRANGPYVPLNCSALNESLLESELFGHARGSFSGAVRDRQGRFEAAHGGDLFLDEVGDLPLATQVKLLRVLETKHIERVGENRSRAVDVRIICATHRDLGSLVRTGQFREDLLFRINVIPVVLPALRQRAEDIPLLAAHFVAGIRQRTGKDIEGFTPDAMHRLTAYDWPGNVRELRSAVEYAFVLADRGRLGVEHLPAHITGTRAECCPQTLHVASFAGEDLAAQQAEQRNQEHDELLRALRRTGGNMAAAARLLGVHRGTVRNRMLKYGMNLRKEIRDGTTEG
ncbi:PAS modulated sigma54 specific transcriptional regulator, Fis family [Oleidesulfovibrio alaskensis G20]|uniref:PAS modulated sigma54 specific transcriptional regulator, Fis family n=1 Tax=Oleidesulfovibrio alaskensis (strain ATCC BAA-1058 / DSM 17464 / G20) TaxID=207559 RepID=Q315D6_OLEA2|nr:sigma-54-dependent Fis family transcriptional regulator [Oleidesulfovibrio alaskensis]ABB37460.1 PAS modulated sigma54 specific transcriptional regulator, Fis family [Oleidesulfovibrio alaskensis G20]MBG0774782.1 sigma-54-dependent Fis family transcriptional regulator [Oleidesulfovibrio alaskensis]